MAGLNRVTLVGNLGKDPEVRYTQGGTAVANFSLATTEKWKDKDGKEQEKTEWHRIIVWGKQAENCGEYLAKGRQVLIEGRLQTREWKDKDDKRQWSTEVVASHVMFLGTKGEGRPPAAPEETYDADPRAAQTQSSSFNGGMAPSRPSGQPGPSDEDIPF
jgi:single-strand DNA-binding protein